MVLGFSPRFRVRALLALAQYQLPRSFSPGCANKEILGFSRKAPRPRVKFWLKPGTEKSVYPGLKAPGQFILG